MIGFVRPSSPKRSVNSLRITVVRPRNVSRPAMLRIAVGMGVDVHANDVPVHRLIHPLVDRHERRIDAPVRLIRAPGREDQPDVLAAAREPVAQRLA